MSGGHQTLKDLVKIVAVKWNRNITVQKKNSHNFRDYEDYINTHQKDEPPSQQARQRWGMFVRRQSGAPSHTRIMWKSIVSMPCWKSCSTVSPWTGLSHRIEAGHVFELCWRTCPALESFADDLQARALSRHPACLGWPKALKMGSPDLKIWFCPDLKFRNIFKYVLWDYTDIRQKYKPLSQKYRGTAMMDDVCSEIEW